MAEVVVGAVNAVDADGFSIAIIPHTRDHTTLGALAIGDRVNLEVDILAKYVERLLHHAPTATAAATTSEPEQS